MSRARRSPFNQEFKLAAIERMAAGENVSALARELGVARKFLYAWRDRFRIGGAEALVPRRPGPKPKSATASKAATGAAPLSTAPSEGPPDALRTARTRIAELERKVGRQSLELDFFRRALRHFEETRRPDDGPGVPASTRSSDR
jgi:transposase-like protein